MSQAAPASMHIPHRLILVSLRSGKQHRGPHDASASPVQTTHFPPRHSMPVQHDTPVSAGSHDASTGVQLPESRPVSTPASLPGVPSPSPAPSATTSPSSVV